MFRRQLSTVPTKDILTKFQFSSQPASISAISSDMSAYLNREVTLQGWISQKPKKMNKKLTFGQLRDNFGDSIQVVDTTASLSKAQVEDCVEIHGHIVPRDKSWELKVISYKTLNQANIVPSQLQDAANFPPQYRYLQLRQPFFQQSLRSRFRATQLIRRMLEDQQFIEVETPLLFKSTPEGAREFLVPTRRLENGEPLCYALPQSPQQYKQLLMASGVYRYFQIARCFRDEDLRSDRQPEFTQVDMEMSFANGEDVRQVVENLVVKVWPEITGQQLKTFDGKTVKSVDQGVSTLTYDTVLSRFGIDKPDLRYELEIVDLSEFRARGLNKDFPVFEVMVLRQPGELPQSFTNSSEYANRKPIFKKIENEADTKTWFEPFMKIASFENAHLIQNFLKLQPGDVVVGSTRAKKTYENPTPLGRVRQLAIAEWPNENLRQGVSVNDKVASWVVDFPLFSPTESEAKGDYPEYNFEQLTATHHPFTMVHPQDYKHIEAGEPLKARGEHYDLVLNGVELGGGSRRIHDAALQKHVLHDILGITNTEELFGHLLNALEMGSPPHAGFAIGFDRMCAMMLGSGSIRDVIAFPKSNNGTDYVVSSPSVVGNKVLEQYNVRGVEK